MRTTIDIPDADHARFVMLARERGTTLGRLLVDLASRGLETPAAAPDLETDPVTGLLMMSGGRAITHEEVKRFLEDET